MPRYKTRRVDFINQTKRDIMSLLFNVGKPLPTERIAKQLGISRITAKKYLKKLKADKSVESTRKGRAVDWWLCSEAGFRSNEENSIAYVVRAKAKMTYDGRQFIIHIPKEVTVDMGITKENRMLFDMKKTAGEKPTLEIKII